jgi:hypothetical protein
MHEDEFTIIKVKIDLNRFAQTMRCRHSVGVLIASSNLKSGLICDILWYHRFSEMPFPEDNLSILVVE